MGSTIQLSVVIPTFNNQAVLQRAVESWRENASTASYEILVIEDGCRDSTAAYLTETSATAWGKKHLRWFHEDDAHELVCTNRGLSEARGAVILAWQDDMFVNKPWFASELVRTFATYPDLGLVSLSRGLNYRPCDEPIERWEDLYDPKRFWTWIGPRPVNWLRLQEVDAVMRPWAVRRQCIETVGVLDEKFRPTEWDEADLCYRIRQAGWKVATHGYERLRAYTHLGSTTLKFSDDYKAKVLRNGQLFYTRWHDTILAETPRTYRTWWRRASARGWGWTVQRMIKSLSNRHPPLAAEHCASSNV